MFSDASRIAVAQKPAGAARHEGIVSRLREIKTVYYSPAREEPYEDSKAFARFGGILGRPLEPPALQQRPQGRSRSGNLLYAYDGLFYGVGPARDGKMVCREIYGPAAVAFGSEYWLGGGLSHFKGLGHTFSWRGEKYVYEFEDMGISIESDSDGNVKPYHTMEFVLRGD
jgi:hypothetical protein